MEKLSLRELQLVELKILEAFHEFCKCNKLTYSLIGGTLLGAVRHRGFIPWDDDIDVGMPRPDYERFYELLESNNFVLPTHDNLMLIPDRGPNAKLPFFKLVNTDYRIDSVGGEETENIWIDIIPVDGYPADDRKAEKLCKRTLRYRRVMYYSYNNCKTKKGFKKIAAKLYSIYAKLYSTKRALRNMKKLVSLYPYETSEKVGVLTWGLYGKGERIDRDSYDNITKIDFEGAEFNCIANYDEYLKGIYGNYMQLPPENKRVTHSFIAYKINKDMVVD